MEIFADTQLHRNGEGREEGRKDKEKTEGRKEWEEQGKEKGRKGRVGGREEGRTEGCERGRGTERTLKGGQLRSRRERKNVLSKGMM